MPSGNYFYERHPALKILILAALKQEIKYLVKELGARSGGAGDWMDRSGKNAAAIVLTGMGVANATVRTASALLVHRPSLVISAGFAGALYEGAEYGELICPETAFLHPKPPGSPTTPDSIGLCGPRFKDFFAVVSKGKSAKRGSIVTLSEWIEKPALKDSPAAGLQYPVCDMETFPVAGAALKSGAEFLALRSITDRADEEIGISPMDIADTKGQISIRLAAGRFASNPHLIPRAIKFGRSSDKAARALASALKEFLMSL